MTLLKIIILTAYFLTPWLSHPISMGASMLIVTLIISMMSGLLMKSFLTSYILMVMMTSGLLVLFCYMSSVMSNPKFSLSIKSLIVATMTATATIMTQYNTHDTPTIQLNPNEVLSMTPLFNNPNQLTFMLFFLLFLSMMIINMIINTREGPLRKK
uniref:NADH dehydrogenase subunit 6 n=1 Tax=Libiocoris heissi TaxID=1176477 RepID=A0A171LG11_9HEMI|nr:NADH dehydrogenase subunit 6 [Libiocoris heissi]AFI54716.1 NADH dehydrogenase subunit 6 [Libiocoris heissi]